MSLSRSRVYQWLSELWYALTTRRQFKPLLQAEFAEGDLYSQANCLFKAGYRETAIIIGSTAVRRSLKQILDVVPLSEQKELPPKSASWKQYAVFELAYFFFNKGIIDIKLRRELSQFQKKMNRVAYGVKLSTGKGQRILADLNAFRPQLDEAMGRAMLTLPKHKRKHQEPTKVVSAASVFRLTTGLSAALSAWHMRAFGNQDFPITDPIVLIDELRGRALISRKQFGSSRALFLSPQTLEAGQVRRLETLLVIAQEQTTAKRRLLTDPEKHAIGAMVGKGHTLEEIYEKFGITAIDVKPEESRDARQVEHREICSQMVGGASCPR